MSSSGRRKAAMIICGLALLLMAPRAVAVAAQSAPVSLRIPGGPVSATDSKPVMIDASIYLPTKLPAPAVILAHGFGGSKTSVADQARTLANTGYVVLTYSARGFGGTIGNISMNSPSFEVADARALISYLATRPEVLLDHAGDPRVGIAGASYGGALALLTAAYDHRVDAVAADITWNNLQTALFPQAVVGSTQAGVFKQLWTSYFFSSGLLPLQGGQPTLCGRFSAAWCALYLHAIATGDVTAPEAALMQASSPSSVADRIVAPTLLSAGEADSLFPLSQVDATAEQIAAAHPQTPVKVVWHSGGHDGGIPETARLQQLMIDWFNANLRHLRPADTRFEVTFAAGSLLTRRTGSGPDIEVSARYPGLHGVGTRQRSLSGAAQPVLAPAGGLPAAITVVPGIGSAAGLVSINVPGQSATFSTAPLTTPLNIVGSSRVRLLVSSSTVVTDVVLFAGLRITSPSGVETLPDGLVAPIRLAQVGPTPIAIAVDLPAIAVHVDPGDRLTLSVRTTDSGYRLPTRPALYVVGLAQPSIAVASMLLTPLEAPIAPYLWFMLAFLVALLMALIVRFARPRHRLTDNRRDLREVPLAVAGLAKQFKNVRAVDDLSFQLPAGEVIGLLGPNGAGKTTVMRMAMGLVLPTEGEVFVFGERVMPGSPVLARVGALVEGAGFLPHLSGRENLDLYWRASGRAAEDPRFDDVFEVANLGTALDRKVRTYSQGMRQRLGIAQAMLGMPDVLMLDEPTNGLDPQQIRAMREVMHAYAGSGRTVIVSSHMLSEVEQTCTYVVVMHRGRLITTGEVSDLLAGKGNMNLEDFFLEVVGDDLTVGKA